MIQDVMTAGGAADMTLVASRKEPGRAPFSVEGPRPGPGFRSRPGALGRSFSMFPRIRRRPGRGVPARRQAVGHVGRQLGRPARLVRRWLLGNQAGDRDQRQDDGRRAPMSERTLPDCWSRRSTRADYGEEAVACSATRMSP